MSSRIKKVNKTTDNKFVNLFDVEYETKNGSNNHWTFASRKEAPYDEKGIDAVVIVPFLLKDGKKSLVVTSEYRVPIDAYEIGFPAGLIEPGEKIEQTIKRELKEETGTDLLEILFISPKTFSSAGITDETCAYAFVHCQGEISNDFTEGDEDIQVKTYDLLEINRLLNNRNNSFGSKAYAIMLFLTMTGICSTTHSAKNGFWLSE